MSNDGKKKKPRYSNAGKGDKSRTTISPKEWSNRWEKIFNKKKGKLEREESGSIHPSKNERGKSNKR